MSLELCKEDLPKGDPILILDILNRLQKNHGISIY